MKKITFILLLFGFLFSYAQTKKYDLYCVNRGDTYQSIAKQFHMTVPELKHLNAYKENERLLIGVSLFVKPIKNSNYHLVRPKETLYSISKKYHTTVATLKRLNRLKSNYIKIGSYLKVK